MRSAKRHWMAGATLAALLLAAGCAHPYVIYLRSGETLYARSEPEFDKDSGFYVFEDESGRRVRLNKDQIVRMEQR